MSAARARAYELQDALRILAEAHGLEHLFAPSVPTETREVILDAVRSSARRADALAAAQAEGVSA